MYAAQKLVYMMCRVDTAYRKRMTRNTPGYHLSSAAKPFPSRQRQTRVILHANAAATRPKQAPLPADNPSQARTSKRSKLRSKTPFRNASLWSTRRVMALPWLLLDQPVAAAVEEAVKSTVVQKAGNESNMVWISIMSRKTNEARQRHLQRRMQSTIPTTTNMRRSS
jgi:hypothetical protein